MDLELKATTNANKGKKRRVVDDDLSDQEDLKQLPDLFNPEAPAVVHQQILPISEEKPVQINQNENLNLIDSGEDSEPEEKTYELMNQNPIP